MGADQDTPLSRYLAELVLGLREARLSEADRLVVRQHLLDSLASAFVGCRSPEFRDLAGLSAPPRAEELGALWAFAINGSVSEDGSREGACHPAAAVIPAVLIFARGRTWQEIDRAIVAGYDVMVRLARCGNPHFAQKGFHATAVTAPFGAAAAVAQLLGYELATTQNALCLAAMGCSGLMSSFKQGSTQPLQVAWGVRSGIAAALMAGKGHAGYGRIFEEGFFPAYLGFDAGASARMPLEYDHAITGCYLKPYPGCRHMHASLDAFCTVMERNGINPAQIREIAVGTYPVAITTGIEVLNRRGDAYFNIPYAIAARSVLGKSDYGAFDEMHFTDPAIARLMTRVSVSVDPEMERRYPKQRGARVEVSLADGRIFAHTVEYPLGEPENPLSAAATSEKFRANASGILTPGESAEIEQMLDGADGPAVLSASAAMIMERVAFF